MVLIAELNAALAGAMGLARGNRTAIEAFPNNEPAFWRSFAAIAIILPINFMIISMRPTLEGQSDYAFSDLVATLVQWVAFPLLMIVIVRLLGLGARYSLFIIAYNWSSVFIVAALMPAALLASMTSADHPMVTIVSLISLLFVLWYSAFLAQVALATTWINAIGIVALDVVTSLLINGLVLKGIG